MEGGWKARAFLCPVGAHFSEPLDPPDSSGSLPGEGSSSDNPNLARPDMVHLVTIDADRNPKRGSPQCLHPMGGRHTSTGGHTPTSRLESIRDFEGISDNAFQLICAAWRKGTEKSYSSAWRCGSNWYSGWDTDPASLPLAMVAQFFTEQFHVGKQYLTLNSHKECQAPQSSTWKPCPGSSPCSWRY